MLEIGRVLRAAPDGLKHHRYVKQAPMPDMKVNPVKFWSVPTADDGTFVFAAIVPLLDETKQQQLFYLNYKQSDADSSKPFIYGDIYRTLTKVGEDGNFRFGDPLKKSWTALNSFQRAEGKNPIPTDRVNKFRSSFRKQMDSIEHFLRGNRNAYIHFDFSGRGWHEFEEITHLNQSLIKTFFEKSAHGYVMSGFLFKTLATGTGRTPGFEAGREFRNRIFKNEGEALDLLYGINYASRAAVRKHDFKVIVLPRADGLKSGQIERFFERRESSEPDYKVEGAEGEVRANLTVENGVKSSESDELLAFVEDDLSIAQFDCVFSKAGGTKPDIDMIEIAGLERSRLAEISRRVRQVREEVQSNRETWFMQLSGKLPKKELPRLTITGSFLKILGDPTRDKKKYQSHLFRVIPQIFNEQYQQDLVILPAFIERTEFSIRADEKFYYSEAKFALEFLFKIQLSGRETLMEINQSPSYQIGLLLGKMASQFSSRWKDTPIKSFEKNYVGLLSRRIASLDDVIAFANDVNQKLIMHERTKFTRSASAELAGAVSNFHGIYDKNQCAFGFFESYFAPVKASPDSLDEAVESALDADQVASV